MFEGHLHYHEASTRTHTHIFYESKCKSNTMIAKMVVGVCEIGQFFILQLTKLDCPPKYVQF